MFNENYLISLKVLIIFFCDPCFYVTVEKFRLLDYVILLHATFLSMALKGLLSVCS